MKSNNFRTFRLEFDGLYNSPTVTATSDGKLEPLDEVIHVIECGAYYKAIHTLIKIANEDFRGNRPQSAVDAYNTLKELNEIK